MRELVIGGFYKHFKDKLYQVKAVAYHSETKEKMVVYQALYGDYSLYVRPYDMFLSEVDRNKYPNVSQKYRFEQVFLDGSCMPQNKKSGDDEKNTEVIEHILLEEIETESVDLDEGEKIDKRLEMFLDAPNIQEKLNVLAAIKHTIDDKLIDSIAVCMDIDVPEGRIEERVASVRSCLLMKQKYECTRLR